MKTAPVDFQDFGSDADEYAHLVADNQIAELAEVNPAMLQNLLAELDRAAFDMELTGFRERELETLIADFERRRDTAPRLDTYREQYGVIVLCGDAREQEKAYNALKASGYECKVVVT